MSGINFKVTKVVLNNENNWKSFGVLRNSDGVMQTLRENANQIGEIVTSYNGIDRAHVIVKTDMENYKKLVAMGKVKPHENGDKNEND